MAGLPQDYQLRLEYAYFKGFTQVETARTREMPLGTVKTRLRAANMHLSVLVKEGVRVKVSFTPENALPVTAKPLLR